MLTICVNSYNSMHYVKRALHLATNICVALHGLQFNVLVAFGGCRCQHVERCGENLVVVTMICNLSDHTIFPAYMYASQSGHITPGRCVMLHDTCELHLLAFQDRMARIASMSMPHGWIFAHLYGLYNLGIATHDFVMQRAMEWQGIDFLPKNEGIAMENGKDIHLCGSMVRSRQNLSQYTLASDENGDVSELDSISITHTTKYGERRFASYISSLGIYKTFTSTASFTMPVYAALRPRQTLDRKVLRESVARRLVTSMVPLVSVAP